MLESCFRCDATKRNNPFYYEGFLSSLTLCQCKEDEKEDSFSRTGKRGKRHKTKGSKELETQRKQLEFVLLSRS